jgi:hypothetical protein
MQHVLPPWRIETALLRLHCRPAPYDPSGSVHLLAGELGRRRALREAIGAGVGVLDAGLVELRADAQLCQGVSGKGCMRIRRKRTSALYLATRSERQGAPVLI